MAARKNKPKDGELDMEIEQTPADILAEKVVKITKQIEKLEAKQAPLLDELSDAMLTEKRLSIVCNGKTLKRQITEAKVKIKIAAVKAA